MEPMFSIITVSLNPGEKLFETLESIRKQTCTDYEIVIKDGGSHDGSMERLQDYLERPENTEFAGRIRVFREPDKSIYEGMNQAVVHAEGSYYYFLNCGDSFYDEKVLEQLKAAITEKVSRGEQEDETAGETGRIFYGDQYDMLQHTVVASNPHMDAFACYRNVPCHQVCIYGAELFAERGYNPEYKVRGDYEHFLWCFFEKKVQPVYVPVVMANYEGGGFSETPANRRRSAAEHREITALYMSWGQRFKYRMILWMTLAPLRTFMAHNPVFSGVYNKCKSILYRR